MGRFAFKEIAMADKLAAAYAWIAFGARGVVPIQPRSKHLVPGFGSRSKIITTFDDARRWWGERDANLGLVLGNGFVSADFDNWDVYQRWAEQWGTWGASYTEITARGAHVVWRWDGPGLRAAVAPDRSVEFKTSGVLMIAPSTNADNFTYRVACADILPLTFKRAAQLFPFLLSNPPKQTSTLPTPKARAPVPAGGSIVAKLKAALILETVISESGVVLMGGGRGELVGLCPFDHAGHKDHNPSLWVNTERQRWGCYSPNCESNRGGERAHDVLNFLALARRVELKDVIRQLAVSGVAR
jgi:hypothetical protein